MEACIAFYGFIQASLYFLIQEEALIMDDKVVKVFLKVPTDLNIILKLFNFATFKETLV